MAVYHIRLKRLSCEFLSNGRKDLEVRVADNIMSQVRVGDTIVFSGRYDRQIKAIRRYASFQAMLAVENHSRIMPTWSVEGILAGLRDIYPPAKEGLGVLVFELGAVTPP